MIIGITGNSGSGKSEITKIIATKINAKIIDADEVVKVLSKQGNEYYYKIVELFGNSILEGEKLNKKNIANIIYNDSKQREKLNELTYKYVVSEIKNEIKIAKQENIIIDVPLLFESKLHKVCDITIGVLADTEIKIERICKRDNIDEKTARLRLNMQPKDKFYIEQADYIIKNNGKIEEIELEEICTKIGKN